ncbi:hypothetical protein GCM10023187_56180 [Nibrella viscosa]|uniref:Secretion system C-terminal sorting domain-containing protein n=1 Tax=Nibrella viscosa TaxID=1084524 RepID=A0ABP8L2A8_9BACT
MSFFQIEPITAHSIKSNTYAVSIDGAYNSVVWQTLGGLQVNGSTSYSGGTSATISTQLFGGRLNVSASNSCATNTASIAVGSPYIKTKLVNGNNSQYPNYINGSAFLVADSDNTATSYNWYIDGGSGYIYPNFNSCNASTDNFMRVTVTTSNQYGTGESYIFYLQNSGYSGYSMVYPNPTDDILTVSFDYKELAEDLLNSVVLYDDKGQAVRSYDVASAKANHHFMKSKNVDLNVKGQKPGTYYLHIQIADKVYKERVIIR